jgi:hypothetical protein
VDITVLADNNRPTKVYMNPRPAYKKLKARLTELDLTWNQTKAIGREFSVPGLVLTPDEYASLLGKANLVIRWIREAWIAEREDDFIQNRYLPALRSVKDRQASMYTVRQVYDYTLTQGVPVEIADRIADKAFTLFASEVLNG